MKLIKYIPIFELLIFAYVKSDSNIEQTEEVQCNFNFGSLICDCKWADKIMKLRSYSGSIRELHVQNCKQFIVKQNSIRGSDTLVLIYFKNIENLLVDDFSFNSTNSRTPLGLHFQNVNIPNIPSHFVRTNLRDLIFENCTIDNIRSFAFSATSRKLNSLRITDSNLYEIEPKIFWKLGVEDLTIQNTIFHNALPSKMFYNCEVNNIRIENSTFTTINSQSFSFSEVETFRVINNVINTISGEAFVMKVSKYVDFRNNVINNLQAMGFGEVSVSYRTSIQPHEIVNFDFNNNRIGAVFPDFNVFFNSDFNMRVNDIYLESSLSCDQINIASEFDFVKQYSDRIMLRESEDNFEPFYIWQRIKCVDHDLWFKILLIVLAVLVFCTLITVFLWCYCWKRKKRTKMVYVAPEPKTYRETVIVTQIENHGLLRTDL